MTVNGKTLTFEQQHEKQQTQLPTRAAFDKATPYEQGWMSYTYAEWPGSKIPKRCPYKKGTKQRADYERGEQQAVLAAQDSEE